MRLFSIENTICSEERNALEAISNGAVGTVKIVEAIIANLIVFLALLALLDSATGWFIGLLGYEGWNFEVKSLKSVMIKQLNSFRSSLATFSSQSPS